MYNLTVKPVTINCKKCEKVVSHGHQPKGERIIKCSSCGTVTKVHIA